MTCGFPLVDKETGALGTPKHRDKSPGGEGPRKKDTESSGDGNGCIRK